MPVLHSRELERKADSMFSTSPPFTALDDAKFSAGTAGKAEDDVVADVKWYKASGLSVESSAHAACLVMHAQADAQVCSLQNLL